jgi:hypothetical protein
VENIDHARAKTRPPAHGIGEWFHKMMLNEFYRVAFRKKIDWTLDELPANLDHWVPEYNEQRSHQGR